MRPGPLPPATCTEPTALNGLAVGRRSRQHGLAAEYGGAASGLPRLPHYVCLFRAVRRLRISQGRLTAPLRVALRVFGPRRELVGSADAHRFRPVDTAVMPDGDELLRRRNDRREVHILVDHERRARMGNSFIRASWVLVSPLLRWRNQLHGVETSIRWRPRTSFPSPPPSFAPLMAVKHGPQYLCPRRITGPLP